MNKKELNNELSKIQTIFTLNNDTYQNILEFDNIDDILKKKSNENNFYKNSEKPIKESLSEENYNSKVIKHNMYHIETFHFFIKGQNNLSKADTINFNSKQNIKENKEYRKRGRQTKRDEKFDYYQNENQEIKVHDKYSDDNLRKKCKNIVLKNIFNFINKRIREIYKGKIGHGDLRKELKMVSQTHKIKSSIESEKLFLLKKLKDIFSENISKRLSNYSQNHNQIIIELLINEKDEDKKNYFSKLFNLTFIECLKYFTEDIVNNKELNGFPRLSSIKNFIIKKHEDEYINSLIYHFKHYEEIINNKKQRNNKKKKNV